VEFEDLKSLTPALASDLRKAGIMTVESFVMERLDELKEKLKGVPEDKVREIQVEAWKALGYWFTPATKLTEKRKEVLTFPTGCKALDSILGGGVRTRVITEFSGEYGSGKTETLLTLLVEALAWNPEVSAIYFDSEESFSEVRVTQIAKSRGYDPDDILRRVIHVPIWHTQHFQEVIKQADTLIKNQNVRLLFVDSIIAPFRAEYVGREVLWLRQQLLNQMLRQLLNYAKAFNLAVVVTNQVVASPQVVYTGDIIGQNPPTGGHILAHNAETRVYLRKATGNKRIAKLMDSSWLPPAECVFQITEKGIEDLESTQGERKGRVP
jgi:DNA repair protein RadA